jgi:esterase
MELNYKTFGDSGSPVLILHGILGSLDNWQTIARKLGEKFKVFTIDQRNHGRSFHSEEMDYFLLAGDIVEFCRQQDLQKVTIIGHSMGGKAAMLLALEHPELIRQLIIVDIAPVYYDGGHEEILLAMAEAPLTTTDKREDIDNFLKPRIHNFGVRQFILKNLTRKENGAFEWKCNLEAIRKHYTMLMEFPDTGKTFPGETHFIKGEQSGYITAENWEQCLTYFPRAVLHTINYAGHWVHADNPEAFLETILSVLK